MMTEDTHIGRPTLSTWLFNPFHYVAGWPALGIGLVALLAASGLAGLSGSHFDGVLDFHTPGTYPGAPAVPAWFYPLEALAAWGVMPPLLYLLGRLLSKSRIRFVDVAGTHALARLPMLAVTLAALLPGYRHVTEKLSDPRMPIGELSNAFSVPSEVAAFAFVGAVVLAAIIWMLVLMYRAFAVSCNVSGGKAIMGFIGVLVIGEILSKVVIFALLQLSKVA